MNTNNTLRYAEEPKLDDLFVVKKFNDWMAEARAEPLPGMLFGRLWLEGEVAVLTSDAGVGKSLLAVQIAESIASGKAFGPFEMTAKAQKVLYLNLKLSSKQFVMRYSGDQDEEQPETRVTPYKFSQNLHRVDIDIHHKLPDEYKSFDEILAPLVERLAKKHKAKVVVIDNITLLQRSVYGYRETNAIMKGLHRIAKSRGISILVLARTSKYGSVRESSSGSSSALFSRFADSVFMIGQSRYDTAFRYLKQLIVHSSEKVYDESHVVSLAIKRLGGNFLGFEHIGFNEQSAHEITADDRNLWPVIDRIKRLADDGKKIREISAEIDIPKTRVHRYLQMWTEQIGAAMKRQTAAREPYDPTKNEFYFPGREEYDEAKNDPKFRLLMDTSISDDDPRFRRMMREYGLIDNASYRASKVYEMTGITPKLIEDKEYAEFMKDVYNIGQFQPQINADDADKDEDDGKANSSSASSESSAVNEHHSREGWPTVNEKGVPLDLTKLPEGVYHSLNAFDHDIWIETEDEYTGKPAVWYSFDSKARLQKHVRDANGVSITPIDKPDGPLNGGIWVDDERIGIEED